MGQESKKYFIFSTALKKVATLSTILIVLMFAIGFVLIEPNFKFKGLKNLDEEKFFKPVNTVLLDAKGKPLEISHQILVDIKKVPKHTIDAFISIEDHRFFEHHGFDPFRILKATGKNIRAFKYKEGASTITQQLVKNTHLKSEKKLSRKLDEIRIARELERVYTKEQILEKYFNILYFGKGIQGLGNACKKFFNQQYQNITLEQSALLAAIINNPLLYNPFNNNEKAVQRRNLVLEQMYKRKFISKEQLDKAKAQKIYVIQENDYMYSLSSLIHSEMSNLPDKDITIQTDIDSNFTKQAYKIIKQQKKEDFDISVVLIENQSNSIVSAISTQCKNLATVKRQPGSVLKPIVVYAPNLECNNISPSTPILDKKTDFNGFKPKNYNDKYLGWTTVEESLAHSLNNPAVKLLQEYGVENCIKFAQNFGIDFDDKDDNLSIALGGMTNGVSLIDLVTAYSSFANLGIFQSSSVVKKVSHQDRVIFCKPFFKKQVMRADAAELLNEMLMHTAKTGTAKALSDLDFEVAAKTGTVGNKEYNTDAYCLAFTSKHSIGVWLGGDKMSPKITGGGLPTHIAKQLLKLLYQKENPAPLQKSGKVTTKYFDAEVFKKYNTIQLASNHLPAQKKLKGSFSLYNPPSPSPLQPIKHEEILEYYINNTR
ncbi:MAG: penicillin-binding protein [Clostridiales bacterium]|jgi:penicillin-binding protein 2A|nr:penicillin-binding protein [Clostridiales bacterium]